MTPPFEGEPLWHNFFAHASIYLSVMLSWMPFVFYGNPIVTLIISFALFLLLFYFGLYYPGKFKMKQTRTILIGGLVCFTVSRLATTVLCVVYWQNPEGVFYPFVASTSVHLVSFVFVFLPNEILEVKCQDYLNALHSIPAKIGVVVYIASNAFLAWIPREGSPQFIFSLLFTFSSLFITCVVINADSFLITRIVDEKKEVIGEYRVDQKGKVFPVNQSQSEPELIVNQ